MRFTNYEYLNRTYCAVLAEMREIIKVTNTFNVEKGLSVISVLIEELQVYGNRMEAALDDTKDLETIQIHKSKALKELKKLHLALPEKDEDE